MTIPTKRTPERTGRTIPRHVSRSRGAFASIESSCVTVQICRSTLLPPLQFSTLLFILGQSLVSLAVRCGSGTDGSLLLLSRLSEHGAKTLDFEFQFAASVFVFGDGFVDFLVTTTILLEFLVGAVAVADEGFDFGLEESELLAERGDFVLMMGGLVFVFVAFTFDGFDAFVGGGDFGSNLQGKERNVSGRTGGRCLRMVVQYYLPR